MVAGTLIAWRKKPGDRVTRGEIIAEVETEKGLIDAAAADPKRIAGHRPRRRRHA